MAEQDDGRNKVPATSNQSIPGKFTSRELFDALKTASWRTSAPGEIGRKVADSLRNDDREHIEKYLDWLYSNISNSIQSIRRLATLIIALIIVFELIVNSGATATITIFSFTISKHSIVIEFIPAVVAFLNVQMVDESIDANRSKTAFTKAFGLWSSDAKTNGLYEYIWPASGLYWSPFSGENFLPADQIDRLRYLVKSPFAWIFNIAVVGFQAQAFYVLFTPHFDRIFALWTISACFSLYCLIADFIITANEFGLFIVWNAVRSAAEAARKAAEAARNEAE